MTDTQEARVVLEDGMHFVGYPPQEAFTIQLDSAEEVGGRGLGARPQSLMLVSLGGCTGMDVISILRKKRQDVTGLEVRVRGERADAHPRVYTHIWVTFVVSGHSIDSAAVERAIELSMTKYCPVAGLLKDVVPIETAYEIVAA
jgi:putative redox protein